MFMSYFCTNKVPVFVILHFSFSRCLLVKRRKEMLVKHQSERGFSVSEENFGSSYRANDPLSDKKHLLRP